MGEVHLQVATNFGVIRQVTTNVGAHLQVRLQKNAGEAGGPEAITAIPGRSSSTPRNRKTRRCDRNGGSGRTRTVRGIRDQVSRVIQASVRKATGRTAIGRTGRAVIDRRAPSRGVTGRRVPSRKARGLTAIGRI